MITMTTSSRSDGTDIAQTTHNGATLTATSRNGAAFKLARLLVDAGAPDEPVEARMLDGRLAWTSPSLHRMAKSTVSEGDQSPRVRPFVPFERENVA